MVKVYPKIYPKYVIMSSKGGVVLLYVQMQKSLYRLLRSMLMLYRKFVKDLDIYGFQINPYNPCVANKMTKIIR